MESLQATGTGEKVTNISTGKSVNEEIQQPDQIPSEIAKIVNGRSASEELSLDEIFELLKNERRREVIRYLLEDVDGHATLSELAEHIAALENEIAINQLSSDQRKRVYIGLYQCHLPKMDEMGTIDFDKNRGTIEINHSSVSQLLPYLERLGQDTAQRLPVLELAITAGVLLVLVFAISGIGPLAALPPASWAAISTLGLVTVALYQVVKSE